MYYNFVRQEYIYYRKAHIESTPLAVNIVHFVLSFKENTSGYGNGRDGWWQINYAHIQHVDSEWKLIILPTSHVAPIKPAAHVHVKKTETVDTCSTIQAWIAETCPSIYKHIETSVNILYDKLSLVKEISDKGLRDTYMSHYPLHGQICIMAKYILIK